MADPTKPKEKPESAFNEELLAQINSTEGGKSLTALQKAILMKSEANRIEFGEVEIKGNVPKQGTGYSFEFDQPETKVKPKPQPTIESADDPSVKVAGYKTMAQ